MNFGETDPMAEPSGLCIDCDKPISGERFAGFEGEDEIVELVCYDCALAPL